MEGPLCFCGNRFSVLEGPPRSRIFPGCKYETRDRLGRRPLGLGTGAVMLAAPAVLPRVMMRVTMPGCVLRGLITWRVACGALLPGGNSRQEKCCCDH